jgi:hypothetical protein
LETSVLLNLSADVTYGRTAAPTPSPLSVPSQTIRTAHTAPVAMAAADLLDPPEDWSWEQLRDYVLRAVAERHGPQPRRETPQVNSIFKSFVTRWGRNAGPIARFAFEQQDGYWRSAPVTITRFTKGNDDYFAGPISERLAHA